MEVRDIRFGVYSSLVIAIGIARRQMLKSRHIARKNREAVLARCWRGHWQFRGPSVVAPRSVLSV